MSLNNGWEHLVLKGDCRAPITAEFHEVNWSKAKGKHRKILNNEPYL
jgi:hypothetical protein